MGMLIDGKAIAEKINQDTLKMIKKLQAKGINPRLEVILVGNDKASAMYDRMKGAAAEKLDIGFELHQLPITTKAPELIKKIKTIQERASLSGLIIQLPLPEHLYIPEVLNTIRPDVDVDCLTDVNLGKLIMKTNSLVPPTPGAVLTILDDLKVKLAGKNVTIVGMGALVGKPLAIMMINEGASVTTCNSRTTNIKAKCLGADIIVTGVGEKYLLGGDMVPKNAIVIDTGISFENGKVFGDVNVPKVKDRAAYVTPTPGGVGPITVALLLFNTVLCAEQKK
ncbi:MAG: bifunctional 5,10-methylenetetrahydrofolate dehydrogenase/5,10-methenyltetrahydrofolate cyclohydrolase [Candidatus Magasanikbacteria bacterium]|nr:bifunctional 5,10-methylenetetrahydrofolate dehydrogenase/5,10-methenyltetrahydrofolate cyclohydrolase [Candidatus Magasanikbacteria bacterium]